MTEQEFVRKNLALSADFSEYLLTDPVLVRQIPDRAFIVFQLPHDHVFSNRNLTIVRKTKKRYVIATKEGEHWVIHSPATS
jgi:hypothetical protein